MTTEEILKLAKECGFSWVSQYQIPTCDNKAIEGFYRAAFNAGIEAAAKTTAEYKHYLVCMTLDGRLRLTEAIRALEMKV